MPAIYSVHLSIYTSEQNYNRGCLVAYNIMSYFVESLLVIVVERDWIHVEIVDVCSVRVRGLGTGLVELLDLKYRCNLAGLVGWLHRYKGRR